MTGLAARQRARRACAERLVSQVGEEVSEFRTFLDWMAQQHMDKDRMKVAQLRILEPFLAAPESGFVELPWDEWPKTERRRYVREAVRREQWLLTVRGPAQQRAERLAAGAVRLRG